METISRGPLIQLIPGILLISYYDPFGHCSSCYHISEHWEYFRCENRSDLLNAISTFFVVAAKSTCNQSSHRSF